MEPGLEHPGKTCTRTGTSGWWRPWTETSGVEAALDGKDRPGRQKEEEIATERSGEENMNKSKEQMRTRRTRIGKKEEKEKKGKRTNTWKPDCSIRGRSAHGLEHPGGGGPGLEHPGKKRPRFGVSGAAKGGGSNGGTKRQGGHER